MLIDGTIILEGGANRGIFTAGVIDFFMKNDIYFSNIIGVSAGAANALNYASHQIGRSKKTIIIDKKENRYINKKKILSSNILDMEKLFETFPDVTFPYDYSAYKKFNHDVDITVTNCKTGETEYHKINPDKRDITCCKASCSMPFAAPIVEINNTPYVDGSVSNSIPLDYAKAKNSKAIVLVLTQKDGYYKKPLKSLNKKMIEYKYKQYPEVVRLMLERPERYNNKLSEIKKEEEDNKIFVIRPEVDTISHLEQDINVLKDFYNHGTNVIEKKYDNFLEYINNSLN
jgi:predicted patatin/cPLA2 family phospholipase